MLQRSVVDRKMRALVAGREPFRGPAVTAMTTETGRDRTGRRSRDRLHPSRGGRGGAHRQRAVGARRARHVVERPGRVPFGDIVRQTHANRGYLRVALRLLASCGWLAEEPLDNSARLRADAEGHGVLTLPPARPAGDSSFLPKALFLEDSVRPPTRRSRLVRRPRGLAQTDGASSRSDSATAQLHDRFAATWTACSSGPPWSPRARCCWRDSPRAPRPAPGPQRGDPRLPLRSAADHGLWTAQGTRRVDRSGLTRRKSPRRTASRSPTSRCSPCCRRCSSATRGSRASIRAASRRWWTAP